MSKIEELDDHHYIFGTLICVANRIDTLLERELKDYKMTAKQWFLAAIIDSLFDEAPTIKEVSKAIGSSHQNVKQVALKLNKNGFINFEKDHNDARATRLVLTEACKDLGNTMNCKSSDFMDKVFAGISQNELTEVRAFLQKLWDNMASMDDGLV